MLAKRIIPCLDIKSGRVVKGIHFKNLRDAGDPVETAAAYSREGADELVFLDITATLEKRKTMMKLAKAVASKIFIPFTVGGGITSVGDIKAVLESGADKISINTAAVKNPKLISEGADRFGSQCIVVAIDAKRTVHRKRTLNHSLRSGSGQEWEVYINAGTTPAGIDAVKWAKEVERLGAGEIMLTSMDCDGTKEGYDIELNRAISEAVNIPVIASGGAGTLNHMYKVVKDGKADAVLAASIFHYGIFKIKQVKQYLHKKKVAVRL